MDSESNVTHVFPPGINFSVEDSSMGTYLTDETVSQTVKHNSKHSKRIRQCVHWPPCCLLLFSIRSNFQTWNVPDQVLWRLLSEWLMQQFELISNGAVWCLKRSMVLITPAPNYMPPCIIKTISESIWYSLWQGSKPRSRRKSNGVSSVSPWILVMEVPLLPCFFEWNKS